MDTRETDASCKLNLLFTKYVPHILEKIFLSLDYESFKICLKVNKKWKELLTLERYQRKGKSVFHKEVSDEEEELWQAARRGNVEEVQSLLSSIFVDVNCARSRLLSTPLCEASYKGHKEVVKMLLDKGADPDKKSKFGGTPIRLAGGGPSCRKDIIKLLLDGGADPNSASYFGRTRLHNDALCGNKDVVQLLLDRGANPNRADNSGHTPLSLARDHGHKDIVSILNGDGPRSSCTLM